jgi:parvulin-like peptidyl-prolyl isomerase
VNITERSACGAPLPCPTSKGRETVRTRDLPSLAGFHAPLPHRDGLRRQLWGKSRSALLLALLLAAVAACRPNERRIAVQQTAPNTVAIVNNERIGYDEFQRAYGQFLAHWESLILAEAGQKREIRQLVVQQLVQDKLLDQEARRRGIRVSDQDVRARVQELVAPLDLSDLRQSAGTVRETVQDWLHAYERRLVHEKLVQQEVIGKLRFTPKEVRDYYNRSPRRFQRLEQIRVRHLCVSSRDTYDRVVKALAAGEEFVQLIRRYSITPDRATDGDLGFVQRGMLPQPLEQAVFESKRVGTMSSSRARPVQTEMGFHVFRIEAYRPEGLRSFEEAEPDVRQQLVQEREQEAYQRWLEQLQSNASITIDTTLLNAEAG